MFFRNFFVILFYFIRSILLNLNFRLGGKQPRSRFLKLWIATTFGLAKLNFGVEKHRATMTSQSKWGRQSKKFKKTWPRVLDRETNTLFCLIQYFVTFENSFNIYIINIFIKV